MNQLNKLLLFVALAALFSSCCQKQRPDALRIKIIETSDVHGALFPWDLIGDKARDCSLAQIYSLVSEERSKPDQLVLLLDNGDILQGDPSVYYANFEKTRQEHIIAQMMNYMKYDAATVGNHDIEPGHAVYDKLVKQFDFPWLAANAVSTTSGDPYFEPYTIIKAQGVKIAILGLITPAIPQWLPPQIWEGMTFQDMIESATYWVDYIKKNEAPDLLVGMFHAGVDYSYNKQNEQTPKNENASLLVAREVPGFDLILVGHDHHGWNKAVTNKAGREVLILGPTSRARDVAVADIELRRDKKSNSYKIDIKGSIMDIKDYPPHQDFISTFDPYLREVKNYVSQSVGTLGETINAGTALLGDAAFTDLIHQAQLDITGADISLAAPLSYNKTIDSGMLNVRDMFKLYRYENLLYTMQLSGQEIKDFLEHAASLWFNTMKKPGDHLLIFSSSDPARLKNPYYNFDSAEGIIYIIDLTKPDGEKVNILSMADGSTFDPDKIYKVALNSYRGNGGGGHLTTGAGISSEQLSRRIIKSTEKDFRYHLMQWLSGQDKLIPGTSNNWHLIPKTWYEQAKSKDSALLFSTK